MCETYGSLPLPGGVLEQPFGLLITARTLTKFAEAWVLYQRDPEHVSADVRKWVLEVMAQSAAEHARERS